MSVDVSNGVILYRANRLRFIIVALFLIPFTILIAWLAYDGIFLGDTEVSGAWLTLPLLALYIWFDYMLAAKLIWPPELGISPTGINWSNYAMMQWPATYAWQDLEGPELTSGSEGVPLLQFVVKATGRKLKLPPSHFGATYDEMAGVISAAKRGRLVSPEQWRSENPPSQSDLTEAKRLNFWLAVFAIGFFFFLDVLSWIASRGGIFSIVSALSAIQAHSPVIDIDENALRFPIIVMIGATIFGISHLIHVQIDSTKDKVQWILIAVIIGGGFVIGGFFGESMITDYMVTHNYSRCTSGDHEQGNGKSRVSFANYVLEGTKCQPANNDATD